MKVKSIAWSIIIYVLFLSSATSCQLYVGYASFGEDLRDLPHDTGGTHYQYPFAKESASPYGHYVYIPGGYDDTDMAYPLLISLHGSGERGDGSTSQLERVLKYGPQEMIEEGTWSPSFPFIVATPQIPTGSKWKALELAEFIAYLQNTYRINASRIYLTGLSMGGEGLYTYLKKYGSRAGIAAAVPLCGKVDTNDVNNLRDVPLWVFHGDSDKEINVEKSINLVKAYNNLTPSPTTKAKLTIFPGVGHNCWTKVYNSSGMGKESSDYDPFDQNIYDWMLQYKYKY
ncbi:hypothetical protein [Spirochaeta cellobiosiphila]|uniref:carboxylesterase family protein n=1 Tax=Spirochaeta cellobiosiphila TaxID=504483 RepID=UPI001B7FE632|nr:hypothetical protein [Spirochaeta cellobiosiphila]